MEVPLSGPVTDAALKPRSPPISTRPTRRNTPTAWPPRSRWWACIIVATAEVGKLTMTAAPEGPPDAQRRGQGPPRPWTMRWRARTQATIYDGTKLTPGMAFTGPAVVEDPGSDRGPASGNRAGVDGFGNIHIEL